jgi:hypothetical protein
MPNIRSDYVQIPHSEIRIPHALIPPTWLVLCRLWLFPLYAKLLFFLAAATDAVQVEGVVGDAEIQQFAYHVFYLLNPRVTKLNNFAAVGADDMVVLLVSVRFFELGKIFPELVLFYEITIHQQFKGVVHRGPADAVTAVLHVNVQRFCIEMVVALVYLFQDGKAFRGFAQARFFQLRGKNLEHFLDDLSFVAVGRHEWVVDNYAAKVTRKLTGLLANYRECSCFGNTFSKSVVKNPSRFYLCCMFQIIISDGIIIRQCLHT